MKLPDFSRRTFLASASTIVALPFLESLLPRAARATSTTYPKRLAIAHMPCGMVMEHFTPSAYGANFPLSQTLMPLASLQSEILVLSNMQNDAAQHSPYKDGEGRHSLGQATLFTGANLQLDVNGPQAMASIDQIYAKSIVGKTPVNSLQLGVTVQGDCDADYACQDIVSISWADAQTPLTDQINPQQVFDTFFSTNNAQSVAQQAYLRTTRKSVLDAVTGQANSLLPRLGSADAQKLDQYFTSVRALEVQLAAIPAAACSQGTRPGTTDPGDFQAIVMAMMDLMTLAFTCDLTRSISFNFGAGHCDHFYSFLPGITDIHHSLSHNGGDQGKRAQLTTIESWELSMLARFWNGLKAIPEGSGTALDNTVTLVSSELADGDLHNYQNLGVLLAGRGGGFINPGRNVLTGSTNTYGNLTSVCLAILQGLGVPVTSFGGFNTTTPMNLLT